MSMRDYAVSDFGLLLDEETIKIIGSKVLEDYTDEDDMVYGLYDKGICEYISDFTGESICITDDGIISWGADCEDYQSEVIAYVPLSKYPTLFKKAYENIDEIVAEFKSNLGEYLPDDFNYRSKIRHISGTYFG